MQPCSIPVIGSVPVIPRFSSQHWPYPSLQTSHQATTHAADDYDELRADRQRIQSQLAVFKAVDDSMSESKKRRQRVLSETPPLPLNHVQLDSPAAVSPPLSSSAPESAGFVSGHPRLGHPHKRSIYVGVNWDQRWGKWKARIMMYGRMRHLGYTISEVEAAKKYDQYARCTPGKALNFPKTGQLQAVKKATVVKRTDLTPADRRCGYEWILSAFLGRYNYDSSAEQNAAKKLKMAADSYSPSPFEMIGMISAIQLQQQQQQQQEQQQQEQQELAAATAATAAVVVDVDSFPRTAEPATLDEASYVAELVERIIFDARQARSAFYEKVHQVCVDINSNPEVSAAALKLQLSPTRIVAMDSTALAAFRRPSAAMALPAALVEIPLALRPRDYLERIQRCTVADAQHADEGYLAAKRYGY